MINRKQSLSAALIALLIFSIALPLTILNAQTSSTVLTIAVPDYMTDTFTPELFTDFEAVNPGIQVRIVKNTSSDSVTTAATNLANHLKQAKQYASSADVLYVNMGDISPETTRAGNLLDIASYVQGDASLSSDAVFAPAFKAFQWDKGIWALPASTAINLWSYDPAAFDQAGIAYPSDGWTMDDLAAAARKLAQRGSDGKVTIPGVMFQDLPSLFYALSGESYYDDSVTPTAAQFAKPTIIALLDQWAALQHEGVAVSTYTNSYENIPLRQDGIGTFIMMSKRGASKRSGALLPNGKAILSGWGFAVSSGTQMPDKAYTLVKYLISNPQVGANYFGSRPLLKSLASTPTSSDPNSQLNISADDQALIDQAFDHAISPSEVRYGDYIKAALAKMQTSNIDATTALQVQEVLANNNLRDAAAQRGTSVVAVATPVPTLALAPGQVSIHFNLQDNLSEPPNPEAWNKVIQDFIASDPEVKQVVLEAGFGDGKAKNTDEFDCFYTPFNQISGADLTDYLSLDSLLAADPSFDKNDVFSGVMSQLTRDNKVWGYPIDIQPLMLTYNVDAFTKANIPLPKGSWTIDAFNDALKALKPSASDPAPFDPTEQGATPLMMLIAAYGGLPIDLRTEPPTVNLTDPTNVDAIRQVLDLARKHYIKYTALTGNGASDDTPSPIYASMLDALSYRNAQSPDGTTVTPPGLVNYPRGTTYNAVSYSLGTAYISAKAANPEACYRWIRTIAHRPDLFQAMPARPSLLANPLLSATQGDDVVAYYNEIADLLKDPNTVVMRDGMNSSISGNIVQNWLNRVFDRYVLHDADLDKELADAQTDVTGYQGCIADIAPASGLTPDEMGQYYQKFDDCAVKVDPSLKSILEPGS